MDRVEIRPELPIKDHIIERRVTMTDTRNNRKSVLVHFALAHESICGPIFYNFSLQSR